MFGPRKLNTLLLGIITFLLTTSSLMSAPRQTIIIHLPPPKVIIQQVPVPSSVAPSSLLEQVRQMDRMLAEMRKQIERLETQMRDIIDLLIEHDKVLKRYADQWRPQK